MLLFPPAFSTKYASGATSYNNLNFAGEVLVTTVVYTPYPLINN